MLLEKAYAKIHGGYYNINSGLSREALRDLTGASTKNIFIEEHKQSLGSLWKVLIENHKKKFIMTCGTEDFDKSGTDDYNSLIGLAGNHAYSILSLKEIVEINGEYQLLKGLTGNDFVGEGSDNKKVVRLLKLRNPWGKLEWKGPWCD